MLTKGMMTSARHDWETPAALFAELDGEFGFTLDVCATPANAKCSRFFSPENDGLAQPWAGECCWMNPPYGKLIGLWLRKALEESQRGATVVCLIPSRTDTFWWHEYVAKGEVRFLRGRLRFVGGIGPAPFPSAIVIFRAATWEPGPPPGR